jgi:hypothetical protein
MYIFHLLRSFRPFQNPIGFGGSDFVELTIAAILVFLAIYWRAWISIHARSLAEKTGWCMLLLAVLPIALRLLLLPRYSVPPANVADDFSYLLLADTLSHFRLANPPHPLHQFFETFFVFQQPSYSSLYPLGQGIALAIGRMLFGHPWAGVALSLATFCSLTYWMLRAWTTPGWSLVGGLLAVIQFGPLNQWMNSYWGGAVSATAGCLVFGSLPRLRERGRRRDAAWLGLGLGVELLTRPYESIFLVLSAILFFLPVATNRNEVRRLGRTSPALLLALIPACALTLLQNRAVTGSWTTLPYALSQYQYGVPAAFTTQPNVVPHRELTREQELDYEIQAEVHGEHTDTVKSYLERLGSRIRFYRFFLLAPLYLALPAYLFSFREFRFVWVLLSALLFTLGSNFYPYFYSHYIAALACLFVLMSVIALERVSRWNIPGWLAGAEAARAIVFLCFAHFIFWYGLHLFAPENVRTAMIRYETWDAINQGDPDGRIAINRRLSQTPGKQLVFVRYWPPHTFKEWVYNSADIDGSRIVWARDLGSAENEKLLHYYPDRTVWLLEPDFRPPRLAPYQR